MVLYTIFAWTAIVLAGAAYYWVYIRRAPLPTPLLTLSSQPLSRESAAEGVSASSSQKRKRKGITSRKRPAVALINDLLAGPSGISTDESEEDETRKAKSSQRAQDERAGLIENRALKGMLPNPFFFLSYDCRRP